MTENDLPTAKTGSWYDGFLYDKLIIPMATWLLEMIAGSIPQNSAVVEVGCGPGALAFKLSGKCSNVTAVDVSKRMIEYANKRKLKRGIRNVEFICMDASQMAERIDKHFDYAVASFCLHEMEPRRRSVVTRNCLSLADRMIIADYRAPFPKTTVGVAQTLLEAMEGKWRYRNFRSWQGAGGIDGFIESMNLEKITETEWKDGIGKTIQVSQGSGKGK